MVSLPSIRLFTIEGRVCFTIEGRLSSIHYNMLGGRRQESRRLLLDGAKKVEEIPRLLHLILFVSS